jgi:hypothetical protein
MEHAMKLTSTQVDQALTQIEAAVVPDDHPMVPKLNGLFGEHTYFLNAEGLTIIEPPPRDGGGRTECQVVHLANWTDANLTSLAPHEPMATGELVAL